MIFSFDFSPEIILIFESVVLKYLAKVLTISLLALFFSGGELIEITKWFSSIIINFFILALVFTLTKIFMH